LATMILKIIEELKPNYVIACYDLPQATYRHEAYKDYKAGRAKTDENLVAQIIRSRDLMNAFSIPMYDKPGFEADDMLGTICEQIKNVDVVIASGDMDTLQLVTGKSVQVYTLKKGIKDTILYDEEAVKARFGFGPLLLPDYKGLRGDPSDNIIGIKGIGEKTATILITKFGTIEEIYKALKNPSTDSGQGKAAFKKAGITDRIIKLLEDGEEEAQFSKMLATIRRDAPIKFELPEKEWKESVDMKKVEELFKTLEFRSLGVRVKEVLGLTDAFGLQKDEAGVAASTGGAHFASQLNSPSQNSHRSAGGLNPSLKDLRETALALSVIDSNQSNPQLEDILQFANTDSFEKAREIILAEIKKRNLEKVYQEIELPLIPILDEMHKQGIKVDIAYLKKLSVEYHAELEKLQKEIWKQAGEEFNVNSPKQLGEMLFVKMGLKVKNQKKTAGGAMSTRESELEKMRDLHPIIGSILEYRELQKLLSTYIDNIPNQIGDDGRLHTTFQQIGAATGRMSSKDPNLQNIPIKSELGRNIRKAFVAEKGFSLVALDYSQIELRIAAMLSGDKGLIEIFKSGRDVHTEVAANVFKVPADKVDKEMRRKAKVINFGILYGMGVNALRANLGKGTSREEAQLFYNEYFNTFTGLANYLEDIKKQAAKNSFTETLFGRRRYFEGLNSKIPYIRAGAERMAINAPIQGTSADILKIAMIGIDALIKKNSWDNASGKNQARMLLQVHDELIFEVSTSLLAEFSEPVKNIMQDVLSSSKSLTTQTHGVPLIVESESGPNWGGLT